MPCRHRWRTALLFGGAGRIAEAVSDLGSSSTQWAGGAGIRYTIAEGRKLNIGIDITYADGNTEIYVQIGDRFANQRSSRITHIFEFARQNVKLDIHIGFGDNLHFVWL